MFADMHVHSQYSDGTLSFQDIVEKAKAHNISLLSICDHNIIDVYLKEDDLCAKAGIKLIAGVEIQSKLDGAEYHVLGYGFDVHNKRLNQMLEYNQGVLADMGTELIKSMAKDYPSLSVEEFSTYERDRKNGGWSSIDYLKSKGLAQGWFGYLKHARKYATEPTRSFPHPVDVIKAIHDAGGYVVVAHLGDSLNQDGQRCKKMASQFLDMGADGFECYYPSHGADITLFLLDFCREHDLLITAGSDDHGGFNTVDGGCVYDMATHKVMARQLELKGLLRP